MADFLLLTLLAAVSRLVLRPPQIIPKPWTVLLEFGIVLLQMLLLYLLHRFSPRLSLVKQLLSADFVAVLGQLSYEVFLLSPLVATVNLAHRTPANLFGLVQLLFSVYVQSFLLSCSLFMLCRAPVGNILRMVRSRRSL